MILTQDDVFETTRLFHGVFPDADLVHSRIVPQGVRVRIVYEDADRNQTLVIGEDAVRAVETEEEYRQLVQDTAREHKFRLALAKVLGS